MPIPLTRYGLREIVIATGVFGGLTAIGLLTFWPAAILPLAAWAYTIWFFRDPQRQPEKGEGFLAPADGKIVDVSLVGPEGLIGRPGLRISIFMSLLDVHVNRSPCDGMVVSVEHHEGGYVDARQPAASEKNESTDILLGHTREGETYPVGLRQIAGLVARRIVTDLRVGQPVRAGQRVGMVKFGSRVEVILPMELVGHLDARIGKTVRAGRNVLVRLPRNEEQP